MKRFLLKIKSWQLFLLICFAPLLLAIIYEISAGFFLNHTNGVLNSPIWAFSVYLLYLTWIYSIADFFSKQLNQTPKYLKLSFAFSLIYLLYYSFYVIGEIDRIASTWTNTLLHFSFQILFMIVFIYLPYQASKALRAVELNHEVSFRDAFADFFCILMFPIGLWFVQPRVRKLFSLNEQSVKPEQATQS